MGINWIFFIEKFEFVADGCEISKKKTHKNFQSVNYFCFFLQFFCWWEGDVGKSGTSKVEDFKEVKFGFLTSTSLSLYSNFLLDFPFYMYIFLVKLTFVRHFPFLFLQNNLISFPAARAKILGSQELHVKKGSTISLSCVVNVHASSISWWVYLTERDIAVIWLVIFFLQVSWHWICGFWFTSRGN